HHHHRENLCPAVGWGGGNPFVAHLGRRSPFRPQTRVRFSTGSVQFVLGLVCWPGLRNGEHRVQLLGLLQYLPSRWRNPESRTEYSTRHFSFRRWYYRALFSDANQHPGRCALARSTEFSVYRQHLRRETLWALRWTLRHVDDFVDCACLRLFSVARVFAGSLRGCSGWQLLCRVRPRASNKTLSSHIAAGLRSAGLSLQYRLETSDCHRRNSFDASARAVYWPGRRRDVAAASLGGGATAV